MRTLAISATLLLALTACGGGDEESSEEPQSEAPSFAEVSETCQSENDQARFDVEDDLLSVSIVPPTGAEDEQRLGAVVSCVVDELGGPSSVSTLVGGTTGNDGQQAASWDGFTAEWVFDASSVGLVFLVKPA